MRFLLDDFLFEILIKDEFFGGETGIRTLGRLPFNGFQDRRNRPLCHLSRREYYPNTYRFAIIFFKKFDAILNYFFLVVYLFFTFQK